MAAAALLGGWHEPVGSAIAATSRRSQRTTAHERFSLLLLLLLLVVVLLMLPRVGTAGGISPVSPTCLVERLICRSSCSSSGSSITFCSNCSSACI